MGSSCYLTMQMLLTQIQLQTKWEELHWWMSADKYDFEGEARFPSALYCGVLGVGFEFVSARADSAYTRCGSLVLPFEVL